MTEWGGECSPGFILKAALGGHDANRMTFKARGDMVPGFVAGEVPECVFLDWLWEEFRW